MNIVTPQINVRSAQCKPDLHFDVCASAVHRHPLTFHVGGQPAFTQRGVALVVSLVLLATMTIIGVATLTGTRLNEQIASNAQQKSIAFEAAESAIESLSNLDDLLATITLPASTANPDVWELPDTTSRLNEGYDLISEGKGIDIDGELSVQYCGETQSIGTSLNASLDASSLTTIQVDINSVANIANSSASADHLRRVSFPSPKFERPANCTVRY